MIKDQWYAIYPSKKLKKGQSVGLKRCAMEFVLFRTQEGKLGALRDRCSHRGAALSKGVVKGECMACPFHGIRFSVTGETQLIPALGKAHQTDLARFNLDHFIVREAHDIIYLWFGEGEPKKTLPFFKEDLSDFVFSEFEDHWNTHYSRAIENQLDVIHLPFVHHNTIGRGNKTLVSGPKVIYEGIELKTSANNEVDHGQKPKRPEDCIIEKTHLRFVFPNLWQNYINETMRVLIYFAPVDDENTVLYIRFYSRLAKNNTLNHLIAQAGKVGNFIVERQDKRVVVTQQPKASSLKSGENLLQGDGPVIAYRKLRQKLIDTVEKKAQ